MRVANPSNRAEQAPLTVLTDHRPPQANVSYIDQMIGEGVDGIRYTYFGGLLGDLEADIVHVHQPLRLVGGRGETNHERALSAERVIEDLDRRRMPLVQTLHGQHQGAGTAWRRTLDEGTTVFIVLDETTFTPDPARTVVIPHANYRERFTGYPREELIPGRLLAISPNRLVKVAAGPLKVFPLANTPGLSLRVAGQAHPALDQLIERVLARHPDSVSAYIGLISDAMMVAEITAAELVILPDNASLVDESMLMLALSLDRPVLVPETAATHRLAAEVGPGWIHHHPGALTAERLDEVVNAVRTTSRTTQPNLGNRDAAETGTRYAEAFRSIAKQRARV